MGGFGILFVGIPTFGAVPAPVNPNRRFIVDSVLVYSTVVDVASFGVLLDSASFIVLLDSTQ